MIFFRSVWRMVLVVLTFAMGFTELAIKRPATRQLRADWLHRFCKKTVKRFGIELTAVGNFPDRGALITNHQSYIDILVLGTAARHGLAGFVIGNTAESLLPKVKCSLLVAKQSDFQDAVA